MTALFQPVYFLLMFDRMPSPPPSRMHRVLHAPRRRHGAWCRSTVLRFFVNTILAMHMAVAFIGLAFTYVPQDCIIRSTAFVVVQTDD